MFGIPKDELVVNLTKIKDSRCGYTGGRCDCKYGASMSGEQNGCPEVSMAIKLIESLTDRQFRKLCKKSGVAVSQFYI